ncbi:hypothetical protein [Halobacillus andaensis]|uniref:hypothetical protein n=1 Tax=Halobacillus andaensis TaxID=1176239 RepID=UPI003D71B600
MSKFFTYAGSLIVLAAAVLAGVGVGSVTVPLPEIVGVLIEAAAPFFTSRRVR